MFLFRKKNANDTPPSNDNLELVTENLYKQNLELAVKNKTLSLLRHLYQISLLTLEPKALAEKLGETIQNTFEFELVAFFSLGLKQEELVPIQFSKSKQWSATSARFRIDFESINISATGSKTFIAKLVDKETTVHTESISEIWGQHVPATILTEFQESAQIKSFLACPLVVDKKIIGVILLALNRKYENIIQYEKESISNFISVIAIALDKAYLYEQLQITNTQLSTANAKLKELDQMKSQFLSFASHQLRSPLTAIKGYLSMALEGDFGVLPVKIKEIMDVIDNSAQSLIVIVNEFLDVSRIEQGRMKYEFTDVDVKKLIQEVVEELRPNVESKGLAFAFTAKENVSYLSSADVGKVKQVIGNIIDNSIKYTPTGSIKVNLAKADSKIHISVSDTGVGIDPEEIPKLFSMFSRAKDASKANVSGTGLGLYVAKQMVEAQQGRIWVESLGKGKGSTFHIELLAK